MSGAALRLPTPEELLDNLIKDGGRTVMDCGDPYEDDLEPVAAVADRGDGPAKNDLRI
jgi:hypothetical protein